VKIEEIEGVLRESRAARRVREAKQAKRNRRNRFVLPAMTALSGLIPFFLIPRMLPLYGHHIPAFTRLLLAPTRFGWPAITACLGCVLFGMYAGALVGLLCALAIPHMVRWRDSREEQRSPPDVACAPNGTHAFESTNTSPQAASSTVEAIKAK